MTSARLSLQPVQASDFDEMLALRIAALRPSLERLGRFDAARARDRLAAGFAPQHMQHITQDGQRIGFVTVHPEGDDALRLEHLYLQPGHQGQGVGAWVLRGVQDARPRRRAVTESLGAQAQRRQPFLPAARLRARW
jgi:GNAT superfamily N-acetyltransferase